MYTRVFHICGHLNAESNVWMVHQSEIRARDQLKADVSVVHGNTALLTFIQKFEPRRSYCTHRGASFDESGFPCIFNAMVCRVLLECER